MRVQKSVDIAAPPVKIWPYFIEPEKVLRWCITFKKFEYISDQHGGVDTLIYIEEQAGGPLMKMQFKIKEYKENEKLSLQMVSGSGVKAYEQSWSLTPTPLGSQFTFMEDVTLPYGFIGELIGNFMSAGSAATVGKMLAKLKSMAEA